MPRGFGDEKKLPGKIIPLLLSALLESSKLKSQAEYQMRHYSHSLTLMVLLLLLVSGCNNPKAVEDIRPVRTIVVGGQALETSTVVTGLVTAHVYVNASFRVPGKMSQRLVAAGSTAKAGELPARLRVEIVLV
jgi:multidrug efflux pump subunit AcrA (membrane-fusion protein)